MTCDDCAKYYEGLKEQLDRIEISQTQNAAKTNWIVDTVDGLRQGFEEMMKAGGPLAMIKMMMKKGS